MDEEDGKGSPLCSVPFDGVDQPSVVQATPGNAAHIYELSYVTIEVDLRTAKCILLGNMQ